MAENNGYAVFADISVLIDYCSPFTDGHEYAKELLNSIYQDGAKIVICKNAGKTLTERIANQQKLFDYLFTEATRINKEHNNPTLVYKGEILNRENLNEHMPIGINSDYNIRSLREELDEIGLDEFRELLHDFQRINQRQQKTLETGMIEDRFHRGGVDSTFIEWTLEGKTTDEAHLESVVNGLYWSSNTGNKMLLRHSSSIYQDWENLVQRLPNPIQPEAISPKEAIES